MLPISRRGFVLGAGAFVATPFSRIEPELILYNGSFWTGSESAPRAQAVAIHEGRILATGNDNPVLALATARTRKIELGGKTVLPGFNDAHAHPISSGVDSLSHVACDKSSIAEIQQALRDKAAKTPAGEWVRGYLYDDAKTPRPVNIHASVITLKPAIRDQVKSGHREWQKT